MKLRDDVSAGEGEWTDKKVLLYQNPLTWSSIITPLCPIMTYKKSWAYQCFEMNLLYNNLNHRINSLYIEEKYLKKKKRKNEVKSYWYQFFSRFGIFGFWQKLSFWLRTLLVSSYKVIFLFLQNLLSFYRSHCVKNVQSVYLR